MTNQSREAFENWATKHFVRIPVGTNPTEKDSAGKYQHSNTRLAWIAWQAALSEGRRQMAQEAIAICQANFKECNARPNCHSKDESEIRALIIQKGEI